MPVVFVSHASRNDGLAVALERWLRANGFTDLFIDHDAIVGGAKWREELRKSAIAKGIPIQWISTEAGADLARLGRWTMDAGSPFPRDPR